MGSSAAVGSWNDEETVYAARPGLLEVDPWRPSVPHLAAPGILGEGEVVVKAVHQPVMAS